MVFVANIPQGTNKLKTSQQQLLANNLQLDASFGTDHYAFSNTTANNGFHQKVTTPDQVTDPTTTTNPILYGKDSFNAGIIQYSKGVSDAVPTPLTSIHSASTPISITPGSTSNVFDFTGMSIGIANLYAFDTVLLTYLNCIIFWNGSTFSNILTRAGGSTATGRLNVTSSGNIFQLINDGSSTTLSHVYWSLSFERIA